MENLPIRTVNSNSSLLLRDVASVRPGTTPGEIDRSAMHRYLSVTANLEGNDLGSAARDIEQAIKRAGEPPRGVQVSVRGQVAPMTEMFRSLTIGLALSVVVIQVLLTAYFQSFRVALVSIGGVPGVVLGVATMLCADGNEPEHRVVHGLDHVHRRVRVELGAAVDLHGRLLGGRGTGDRGRHRGGATACGRSS